MIDDKKVPKRFMTTMSENYEDDSNGGNLFWALFPILLLIIALILGGIFLG